MTQIVNSNILDSDNFPFKLPNKLFVEYDDLSIHHRVLIHKNYFKSKSIINVNILLNAFTNKWFIGFFLNSHKHRKKSLVLLPKI